MKESSEKSLPITPVPQLHPEQGSLPPREENLLNFVFFFVLFSSAPPRVIIGMIAGNLSQFAAEGGRSHRRTVKVREGKPIVKSCPGLCQSCNADVAQIQADSRDLQATLVRHVSTHSPCHASS